MGRAVSLVRQCICGNGGTIYHIQYMIINKTYGMGFTPLINSIVICEVISLYWEREIDGAVQVFVLFSRNGLYG